MDKLTQMQIEESNKQEGRLKGYDCPLCKNKGVIYMADDNGQIYARECECMTTRAMLQNVKLSGLENYINKKFEDYKTAEQWQRDIYCKAVKYIKDSGNKWFVIAGQSGSGKTLICSIIANELLFNQRKRVIYLTWTDFVGKVKRNLMGEKALSADKDIEKAKNAEVLFIDEFLKTHTEADMKYIVEIINYRYAKQLKTIITSELSADELIKIDEAMTGRIVEMSGEYLSFISKDINKNQRFKGLNTY